MSQTAEKDPQTPSAAPAGETPRPGFQPGFQTGKPRDLDPGSSDEDNGTKVGRGLGDEEASA